MAEAFIRPQATSGAVLSSFDLETLEFFETFEWDATFGEDYTTSVSWTQHPVEDGADITDNAVVEPERATLSGVQSQTPIVGGDASIDRLEQADQILRRLARDRRPLLVITGLRTLDGYVITNLTVSRTQTTGQSIAVAIDLQELITVQAQFTEVPPAPVRADKKGAAAPAVDGGTKAPVDTTPEAEAGEGASDEEKPKSTAAKGYDAAKAAFSGLIGGGDEE